MPKLSRVDASGFGVNQHQAVIAVAEFFRLHPRTVYRWISEGVSVFDPGSVARHVRGIKRPTPEMVHRLAEGDMEERLAEILEFDPETPPPFAARVLGEMKDALTGVLIARLLFEEEEEFVAKYGGTVAAARRRFGVTTDSEVPTLLWAMKQLLKEQAEGLEEVFQRVGNRRLEEAKVDPVTAP